MTLHDVPRQPLESQEAQVKPTELIAFDIDRTLIKTGVLYEKITELLKAEGILTEAQLDDLKAKEKAERGNAFDYLAVAYEMTENAKLQSAETIFELVRTEYADEDGYFPPEFVKAVIIDGVFDLLAATKAANAKAALMTAGGEVTQMVKVMILQAIADQENERRRQTGEEELADIFDFIIIDNDNQRKFELLDDSLVSGTLDISALLQHAKKSELREPADYDAIQSAIVIDDKIVNALRLRTQGQGELPIRLQSVSGQTAGFIAWRDGNETATNPAEFRYQWPDGLVEDAKRFSLQGIESHLRSRTRA